MQTQSFVSVIFNHIIGRSIFIVGTGLILATTIALVITMTSFYWLRRHRKKIHHVNAENEFIFIRFKPVSLSHELC